ncbi:MAG: flagellar basal body P-ring protein FlgI, partial [Thermofilaceae archaeon]
MKRVAIVTAAIGLAGFGWSQTATLQTPAVRLKDVAQVRGVRSNQLIGYGLVVGLEGTGDSKGALFTVQSIANMLERFGITIPADALKVKNVAAVMVTAELPPF